MKYITPLQAPLSLLLLASLNVAAQEKWECQPTTDNSAWECIRTSANMLPEAAGIPPAVAVPPMQGRIPAASPALPTPPVTRAIPQAGYSDAAGQCGANAWPTPPLPAQTLAVGETLIHADRSQGEPDHFVLTGNVDILRDTQRLLADKVIYDKQQDRADAEGNVFLVQEQIQIRSDKGYKQIEGEQAEFTTAQFRVPGRNARGTADNIFVESATMTHLTNTTYNTCPPGQDDWLLRARTLKLDEQEATGTARDVSLRFKNVPIFYTPYLSFPISDQRKSGFLVPSYGSSDQSGTDISIPWYWNIAPNRDATITPRILSNRGVQLAAEYRYLHARNRGNLGVEVLPDDDLYQDDRALVSYQHTGEFGTAWSTSVDLNNVSDDDYFTDLGENLSLTSITHLERRIDLTYAQPYWSLRTRVQNFQPVNSSEAYQRLPQITFTSAIPEQSNSLNYYLSGEYVRFDHKLDVTDGGRLDLYPALGYDYSDIAWFLRPRLGLRYTRYDLDTGSSAGQDDPSRTAPVFSLDSGLFLERDSHWGSRALVQTLEPRLFYLYTPYRDQNNIPVFDTSALDFSAASLFRYNRFSGPDRQGDANQVALAATTRFIDQDSGFEYLSATIGEIFYLEDRLVTIGSDSLQQQSRSDIVGGLTLNLSRDAALSGNVQWDTQQEYVKRSSLSYNYRADELHIFNASYRQERSVQEQIDLSAYWPLSQRWSGMARYYYSLRDERTLEGIAGLEYNSCCWSLRFVARRYANDGVTTSNTFFIQLSLKGLTSIGDEPTSVLEQGIYGYSDILGTE